MLKLKVINIDEYNNYTLENNSKLYSVNINFTGDKSPEIGDYIYLPKQIVEEVNLYTYGPLNSNLKRYNDDNEKELMKVITKKEEYYLQRYYG